MNKNNQILNTAIYLLLLPITYAIAAKYLGAETINNNKGFYLLLSCLPSLLLFISDMNKVSADEEQRKSAQNTGCMPKEYLKKKSGKR